MEVAREGAPQKRELLRLRFNMVRELSVKMNFAKGIYVCSEEERKMVWMREVRIRLFLQMQLEACRDECK